MYDVLAVLAAFTLIYSAVAARMLWQDYLARRAAPA